MTSAPTPPTRVPPNEAPQILMVDDDPVFLGAGSLAIRRGGMVVHTAPDAQAAIALSQRFRPTVLVTDMQMPGMDGVDLFTYLRERFPLVRGILVSAHVDGENLLRIARSGIHSVLCKSDLNISALRQAVFSQLQEADRWVELLGRFQSGVTTAVQRRQKNATKEPS